MATRGWKDFWCYSQDPLSNLFERFRQVFPVVEEGQVHDCENVFEWFEGETADGNLGFNLSRPHIDDDSCEYAADPNAPIRVRLYIDENTPTADELGQQLANVFGLEVHAGEVEYLGGIDFAYRVHQTFRPGGG